MPNDVPKDRQQARTRGAWAGWAPGLGDNSIDFLLARVLPENWPWFLPECQIEKVMSAIYSNRYTVGSKSWPEFWPNIFKFY